MRSRVLSVIICFLASGCSSSLHYTTPTAGVSLADISDTNLRAAFATPPAALFPATIAVARVQGTGYYTRTSRGYGHGRYTIVTTRDIESDESYEKMSKLPLVSGVAPIGRLLLPANANSIDDLRTPAAQLRADLLLVYTVDSSFVVDGKSMGPLSLITLGLIRNKTAHVTSTVAGLLIDVRTGFIYGTTEATAVEKQRASIWSTELAIDSSRIKAEQIAFDSFVDEFQDLWSGVLNTHVATRPAAVSQQIEADKDRYYRVRFNN